MNGFFLTLDGIYGAGKSTHLDFIRNFLQENQVDTIFTREHGGTALGESLRSLLLNPDNNICADAETLLMFAARSQHLNELIIPALNQGKWVVSDRFTDASFAYQCGGRNIPLEKMKILENWVQNDFRPDFTIILDIPLEISIKRIEQSRDKDRFELEQKEFFSRVRNIYLERANANPERYAVVDSSLEKEVVQKQIKDIISGCLKQYQRKITL